LQFSENTLIPALGKENLFTQSVSQRTIGRMKQVIWMFLLISSISIAQSNEEFFSDFLLEDELKPENTLAEYNKYDFSPIWFHTENYRIFGIIGEEHQRIKIKLLSINRDSASPSTYLVSGKSCVKETICDFYGTIKLTNIKEVKELHFGIDDEYLDKGVISQGILIAEYEFKENESQIHSGIFEGKLYTKWYLDSNNEIKYDDIQSISDGYLNNAFIGTWKSYSSGKEKTCNWADFRVPKANIDFDIGAGEFSPSEKYYKNGWESYHKAWLLGDHEAKKKELEAWWE
jgi:hypothetical protein